MHRQIAWIGFYDLTLSKHIARLAAKGGTLVDVGANIGYFSCLWAAARPGNRVYAFEPSPRVFHLLKANIEEAGVCSSVKAYQLVLSKEKKQIQFDPGPEGQSGWGGITNEVGRETILMQADRLDDVMPADLYVEVLKIDTEGADAWVLEGAERLLSSHHIRHIFFEQNVERMSKLGIPVDAAFRILQSCGYKVNALGRDGTAFWACPA